MLFLVFCLQQDGGEAWVAPTTVATIGGLLATAASIGGQELAQRWGRRRVITVLMLVSALTALLLGFTAMASYTVAVAAALFYMFITLADSAALTAGTVENAEPGRRGATLAVYSLGGFGGAFMAPLVMGMVLDLTGGGQTVSSWVAGFASLAVAIALGPLLLHLAGRRDGARGR